MQSFPLLDRHFIPKLPRTGDIIVGRLELETVVEMVVLNEVVVLLVVVEVVVDVVVVVVVMVVVVVVVDITSLL